MKGMVLMNKKTGDLLVGYRVCFFDKIMEYAKMMNLVGIINIDEYDGWLIEHPGILGEFRVFFNRELEEWCEILGEL